MGAERKKTGGGAGSAVRGAAAALAVTGLLFLLPGLLVPGPEAKGDGQTVVSGENAPSGTTAVPTGKRDGGRTVLLLKKDGTVEELTMADYLWGVVAAEMPASFEEEALKAQTCAARTYTAVLQKSAGRKHPDADICADSTCCQAYIERSDAQARWGLNAQSYSEKIARAVADAGADALSLINTLRGMRIDVNTHRPILKMNTGGLSGPAVLPVAVRMVWEVAQAVDIPILGMGGVSRGEDAAQLMLAGASAVAVGTALFADPYAPIKVRDELGQIAQRQGLTAVKELTGQVKPW